MHRTHETGQVVNCDSGESSPPPAYLRWVIIDGMREKMPLHGAKSGGRGWATAKEGEGQQQRA